MIEVTGDAPTDVTNSKFGLALSNTHTLKKGDEIKLIHNDATISSDAIIQKKEIDALVGYTQPIKFSLENKEGKTIIAKLDEVFESKPTPVEPEPIAPTPDPTPQPKPTPKPSSPAKSIATGRLAVVDLSSQMSNSVVSSIGDILSIMNGLINYDIDKNLYAASTHQASDVIPSIYPLRQSDELYITGFVSTKAFDAEYDTSKVELDGYSIIAGVAFKQENLMLGGFFEYGDGDFDSDIQGIKSSGDVDVTGLGILGRYDFNSNFYLDGYARVGGTKTNYNGNILNNHIKYDVKSTYYGLGLGVGYIAKLNSFTIDTRVGYDHTAIEGKDADGYINGIKQPLRFDDTKSNKVRLDSKFIYTNLSQIKPYLSANLEYEFDKDAIIIEPTTTSKVNADGFSGGVGIGLRYTPTNNFFLELEAKQSFGEVEQTDGRVSFGVKF